MGFSGFSLPSSRESRFSSNPLSLSAKRKADPSPPEYTRDTNTPYKHPTTPIPASNKKPRFLSEDEYFNRSSSDSEAGPEEEPDRPAARQSDEDSQEDTLDAFMTSIQDQVTQQAGVESSSRKAVREDIEQADDQETYFQFLEEQASRLPPVCSDDEEVDYDSDGFPISPPDKPKLIEPLPRVNHDELDYSPFEKNFYRVHSDVTKLSPKEVYALRECYGLRVSGAKPCHPCISFGYLGLRQELTNVLTKSQYSQPTPIQVQALPAAMEGRDIIGIAQTGSGKTLGYLLPLIVHVLDQEEMKQGDGPIGLILAPTRELCQQIYHDTKRFCKPYNIGCCPIYGGVSRWEQTKALKEAPEIVIATPGRMIDMIKSKTTNLLRTTFLVVDEADRMFDMGFEAQVRSIVFNVRPDKQALMFSATFRKRVESLAREALTDPIRICVGVAGEANEDVSQHVVVLVREEDKWQWLTDKIVGFCSVGSVIVFVTKRANSELLVSKLKTKDISALLLHGEMDQGSRDSVLGKFKRKEENLLVATDVASRGLDIAHVRTVVNYDVAKTIDTHTHRIGRTGRAGEKGDAYTLVTSKDKVFAGDLVRNLEGVNQEVPSELMSLATQVAKFKRTRQVFGFGRGKRMPDKKRLRPGLGSTDTTPAAPQQSGPLTSRMEMYQTQYKTKFIKASDGSELASTSSIKSNCSVANTTDSKAPIVPPQRKSRFDSEDPTETAKPSKQNQEAKEEQQFIKPAPKKKQRWDS